jgi:hypothetical protein
MNTARFNALFTSASAPVPADLEGIQQFIRAFPYFFPAYAVQARIMKSLGSFQFEKSLTLAAVYAPDRTLLHSFIHTTQEPEEAVMSEPIATGLKEEKSGMGQPPAALADTIPSPVQAEVTHAEIKTENPATEEKHRLVSIIEERLEEIEKQQQEKPSTIPGVELLETNQNKEVLPDELPTAAFSNTQTEQPKTFTGWLKHISNKKTETAAATEMPNAIPVVSSIPVVTNETRAEETGKTDSKKATEAASIIDKFIAEEPRISTARPGFYNPANAARESVEDHEDLASPTLAQIYLMQGNKEKAMEIYRRLMLLYPEKSHFFAAQIEKIQHS